MLIKKSSKIFARLLVTAIVFTAKFTCPAQQNDFLPDSDLPNPVLFIQPFIAKNNYITPLLELKSREEKYLASPVWKESYLEMMNYLEGWVGDYDAAYDYENRLYAANPGYQRVKTLMKGEITSLEESSVAGYEMLDALDAVTKAAANRQVVMINEEHRTPFHRAMTLQLLPRLYAAGFRYFAAETVNETDTNLNSRKYPTQQTGYYTADPLYADVIRTALRLGFKVVPYDDFPKDCQPTNDNPELCNDKRERMQAQNLYDRILKNDPQAKIFVHVGRGHNSKAKGSEQFNFMGYYFKQITGIDSLAIDQLRFSERRDLEYEQPLYRFLTKSNLLNKPSVFQSPDGKNFYSLGLGYDMMIFYPRMQYETGRASVLKMNGLRAARKINLKKLKLKSAKNIFISDAPVLIQAYYYNENAADAVPVDQIILYPNKEISALMLPKGAFIIRAMNETGKIIAETKVS